MIPLDDIKVGSTLIAEPRSDTVAEGMMEGLPDEIKAALCALEMKKDGPRRIVGTVLGYDLPFIMLKTNRGEQLVSTANYKMQVISNGLDEVIKNTLGNTTPRTSPDRPNRRKK